MARKPAWTEEEIILATELYIRSGGRVLGAEHPDVIELSKVLNNLNIHDEAKYGRNIRKPSAIEMKLANIRGADPTREGGFLHGSKRDSLYWDELDGDEHKLFQLAAQIRRKKRSVRH